MGDLGNCPGTQTIRAVQGTSVLYTSADCYTLSNSWYLLPKANCWFLVSIIYESLGDAFHGSTLARFLYLRKASEDVRREIRTTANLIVTFPFIEVVRTLTQNDI